MPDTHACLPNVSEIDGIGDRLGNAGHQAESPSKYSFSSFLRVSRSPTFRGECTRQWSAAPLFHATCRPELIYSDKQAEHDYGPPPWHVVPDLELLMLALTHLRGDAEALALEWADGIVHRISWRELRDRCPCATCAHPPAKASSPGGFDLLPVLSFAETLPLKASGMRPLGNYAYAIQFSDGHNTGIYSLDFLRSLGLEIASRS